MVPGGHKGDNGPVSHDRPVGELLRDWRRRRRLSQLELALRTGTSARHVSFVETGRTIPSSAMVLRLAEQLAVPLRERNRLLIAAGHAPAYRQQPLDDPDMARVRSALESFVEAHAPFPALAVDGHWNLIVANSALDVFLDGIDPALLEPPINMMRIGLRPDGMAPRIINLPEVRSYLLARLARQATATGDIALHGLYDELISFGPIDDTMPDPAEIALQFRIRHRDAELSFLTAVTTFGAAFDITLAEVAVETYLPADAATVAFFQR
jgi:transcriptional regulator with XRE-family HTH domain